MLREDLLITPTLLRRFVLEAEQEEGDHRHYAIMMRANRDLVVHNPGSPDLDPGQFIWAEEVLRLLNRELHFDGAWVCCFTDPVRPQPLTVLHAPSSHWMYSRYCLIWIDRDGDPQFTQEWVAGENSDFRSWADVVNAGIVSTAQKCATAWQAWKLMMRDVLDPQEHQLIKAAQGQRFSGPH